MKKKKMTVCFADLKGYARLAEAEGDEKAVSLLQEAFKAAGDAILNHRGKIRKYIGDALLCTFDSPEDALSATREIALYRATVGDLSLSFCMGIATGEVLEGEIGHPSFLMEDVMGNTVNRAAMLMDKAGKEGDSIVCDGETGE